MKISAYLFAWFPMMVIAIANGAARDLLYKGALGELRAHQASTVSLAVLFALYFAFLFGRWKLQSTGHAVAVGALWLVMTLAFEFGLGRLAGHKSWGELFQEYNVLTGRLWVFIPLWVATAPSLFYRVFTKH